MDRAGRFCLCQFPVGSEGSTCGLLRETLAMTSGFLAQWPHGLSLAFAIRRRAFSRDGVEPRPRRGQCVEGGGPERAGRTLSDLLAAGLRLFAAAEIQPR